MATMQYADRVSRQQFKLTPQQDGVVIESLGINPTRVVREGQGMIGGTSELLSRGEVATLHSGDHVLLLAANPTVYVEMGALPTAGDPGTSGPGGVGVPSGNRGRLGDDNGRPSKRARSADAGQLSGQTASTQPLEQQPGEKQQSREGQAILDLQQEQEQQQEQQLPQEQQEQHQPPQEQQEQQKQDHERGEVQQQEQQEQDQERGEVQQHATEAAEAVAGSAPLQQVCLILVGVQGSGKSTFSAVLAERSALQWVRINQDSIAGTGRRGTRELCLEAAQEALQQGKSVIIDRTNLNQDQRRAFIRMAQQQGAQPHSVVLALPVKTCMARAAERPGHEGGLQGNAVYVAINRANTQYKEAGPPQEREGLSSVLICESDAEAAAALQVWARYGPGHTDVTAEWQQLRPAKKPVNTIDRFFKKQLAAGAPSSGASPASAPGAQPGEQHGQQQQEQDPQQQQQEQEDKQQQQQQQQEDKQQQHADKQQRGGRAQTAASARRAVDAGPSRPDQREQSKPAGGAGSSNAFQVLMSAARPQHAAAGLAKPAGTTQGQAAGGGSGSGSGSGSRRHYFAKGPFVGELIKIAAHPERQKAAHPEMEFDDRLVLVLDKFPKARRHLLVIARDPQLQGPLNLTAAEVPLLEHMEHKAQQWVARQEAQDPALTFKMGFHAAPSMQQLHLHVISQDFESAKLKSKKHWNSFTHPDFFLELGWVVAQLRESGCLGYDPAGKEGLLGEPLRCHRCGARLDNIPKLKAHIAACKG